MLGIGDPKRSVAREVSRLQSISTKAENEHHRIQCSEKSQSRVPVIWQFKHKFSASFQLPVMADDIVPIVIRGNLE
jgi:hypothetical protein